MGFAPSFVFALSEAHLELDSRLRSGCKKFLKIKSVWSHIVPQTLWDGFTHMKNKQTKRIKLLGE